MYLVCVLITALLMLVGAIDYIRRAWIRETNPVLATWILIVLTMALSFWMYWNSSKKSLAGNIGLISAPGNTVTILAGVLLVHVRANTLRIAFDKTQKWCLVLASGILVIWLLSKAPLACYALVQCIALVGYFATAKRLWRAKQSTEPVFVWTVVLLACLSALYPAWVKKDLFAWIFLCRGIPSTACMLCLIVRAKRKSHLLS